MFLIIMNMVWFWNLVSTRLGSQQMFGLCPTEGVHDIGNYAFVTVFTLQQ